MNEVDLREDQTRGIRAGELLTNELLNGALKAINDEIVKQWGECPMRDHEAKEALWQLLKTSQKFEGLLRGYIETGKLATEQMRRYEEEKKRGFMSRLRTA